MEAPANQRLANSLAQNPAAFAEKRGSHGIYFALFLRFSGFLGFFPLQALDRQPPAAIKTLQKKSCLKTDGRFSLRPGLCHNPRMNVEMTGRNEGCEGWTAAICRPGLPAQCFGARNDSSAFRHSASKRRCRAHTPEPAGLFCGKNRTFCDPCCISARHQRASTTKYGQKNICAHEKRENTRQPRAHCDQRPTQAGGEIRSGHSPLTTNH